MMNSSSKTRRSAAVIGCGRSRDGKEGWAIGHFHAAGYLAADPGIDLMGVDVNADNLAAFGETFAVPPDRLFLSTEALYAHVVPEFVSVCTWPALHAPMVIEAAHRGVRGIFCEKPMATSPREIREMMNTCARHKAKLAVAHQRRLEPVFQRLREIVRSGELGGELVFEGRIGEGWDILSWTTHLFDLANFVFGVAPSSVLAGMDHTGERRYQQAVENASIVFCEYPKDCQAVFISGPSAPGGFVVQVRGTQGSAVVSGHAIRVFSICGYREESCPSVRPPMELPIRELMAAVESGDEMTCGADGCAVATELAYAAHESARTLRRIRMPMGVDYAPLEVVQAKPNVWLPEGRLVLFADDHFGSGGREGLAEAVFACSGRTMDVICAEERGLVPGDLETAGMLLIYHTQGEADDLTRRLLRDWVHAGRPLAVVHAGLGAYPRWEEYADWCGRVWDWTPESGSEHPTEPCLLRVVGSFGLQWREAALPDDEVFVKLREVSPCQDLVSAERSDGARHPAAWVAVHHPNVGVWVPGHRRDMWSLTALREGLTALLQKIAVQ